MYVTRLCLASDRADQLDLPITRIAFINTRFPTPDVMASLPGLFDRLFGSPSPAELASNASAYHLHLVEPLAGLLRTPVFVTVGYIGMDDRVPLYYHTDAELKAMLASELPAVAGRHFHTWLTLSSGEILDFVLGGVATSPHAGSVIEGVIAGPANDLADSLVYYPSLLGPAFLERAGIPDELACLEGDT